MKIQVDVFPRPVCSREWRLVGALVLIAGTLSCSAEVTPEQRARLLGAEAQIQRDPAAALATAVELHEQFPRWEEPPVVIGRIHALQGNPEQAFPALREAIDRSPSNRQAAIWLARSAVALGDDGALEQAAAVLEAQLAEDRGDARLYHALALVLEAGGDITGALAAHRMAAGRLSHAARIYLDIGRIYYRLGLHDRAEAALEVVPVLAAGRAEPLRESAQELAGRIDAAGAAGSGPESASASAGRRPAGPALHSDPASTGPGTPRQDTPSAGSDPASAGPGEPDSAPQRSDGQ